MILNKPFLLIKGQAHARCKGRTKTIKVSNLE